MAEAHKPSEAHDFLAGAAADAQPNAAVPAAAGDNEDEDLVRLGL